MNYKFPIIEHISQVEKVIKDLPEIPIIDKGDYKVIAYRLSTPELFPSVDNEEMAIRRECRGLIFDKSGKIISRPYHKFFNVNEKEETFINKINITEPHIILSKLDGCCSEDTIIITEFGTKTIKDLCENNYDGKILGYDHEKGAFCWTIVENCLIQEKTVEWFEISLENGSTIKLTGNHLIWCENKKSYIPVNELTLDDEVVYM